MSYSVKARITSNNGASVYDFLVPTGNDTPGDVAAAYGLADPLVIKQSLQGGDRGVLSHPDIEEATLTIIAASAATYADMAIGDPVAIAVWSQAGYAGGGFVRFAGRIAGILASPHKLGVLYTVQCVDYLADLRELPVGAAAWPAEEARLRVNRIAAELNVSAPTYNWTTSPPPTPTLVARSAGETDAYSALVDALDSWYVQAFFDETGAAFTTGFHTQSYRPRLTQNLTGSDISTLLVDAQPFTVSIKGVSTAGTGTAPTRRSVYAPPGRLANVAGLLTVGYAAANSSPSTGAPILDGARVNFDVTLSQAKGQSLANVTRAALSGGAPITYDWRTAPDWSVASSNVPWWFSGQTVPSPATAGPAIIQNIDSILDPSMDPASLVALYRSPFRPEPRLGWNVGTLHWEAWKEPVTWKRPELTELLTVANIQAGKLPSNREWVNGLVSATTLTIAKGRVSFDIDLLPFSYDFDLNRFILGATLGTVSLDSPVLSGVLLNQLAARDTLADYATVRGS